MLMHTRTVTPDSDAAPVSEDKFNRVRSLVYFGNLPVNDMAPHSGKAPLTEATHIDRGLICNANPYGTRFLPAAAAAVRS